MSEWKTYRLGEIVDLFDYKRIPLSSSQRLKRKGIYPYYGAQGIIDYIDDYIFDGEFLLVAEDGENLKSKKQDIAQIAKGKYWVNNHAHILKSNGLCNLTYLCYILNRTDISGYITGSAQPKLNQANLLSIILSLPSIEEQNKIASFILSFDDKIELNRRINANLEAQAQALFRSWFVDFEPFRDGPFVDSELGKIPQGWKIGTLSEIGDVIGGGTPSKIKPEYYTDNGIAWITPKDLSTNNCKFTSKGETDISELGYKNSSAKLMPRGSVLFSSRAPIGYISIAKNEICTNQGFKSIVPKKAGTCFIYYFLRNNTSKIESMASGSTFKEASGGLMKSLEVIIPSNKILTAFEEAIQPLFNMQEHNEDENARLSALRDILLPKLMAGEINLH